MNTPPPVDGPTLGKFRPVIVEELHQLIGRGGTAVVRGALKQVFALLFGAGRTRREEVRFLLFAAPIARKIVIGLADGEDRFATTDIRFADLRDCLRWLDSFDPLSARMIDLRYVAGLGMKDTAAALQLAPRAVLRDLRFAKSWVRTKL